ncbi:MAG: 23S rRNA (adenosine(1067)-2'-O)-methyltransferase [Chlamydiae bacterium]|nr:23S rRNA (adenosine(1067)-2'-O)-methyltransferase [Chlamydiota bacterium]
MYTKEITSLQHPIVKHLTKLRKSRRYRQECGRLLLEGKKMVEEYQGTIETLLTRAESTLQAKHHYTINDAILEKISSLKSPEPYLAEVTLPPYQSLSGKTRLLALDAVSDPGNLGTLLRTALAFGFEGVFLTEGSADPYSDKALRAAKGATFRLPLQSGTIKELLILIKKNGLTPYVAERRGEEQSAFTSPLILILGNEAHGPSPLLKEGAELTALSISDQTESLNVAVAGGILMHKIKEMLCQSSTTI